MLIYPPVVPPPYFVVPVPGTISILEIDSTGIVSNGMVPCVSSKGLIGVPSIITFTRLIVLSPLPRKSTIGPNAVCLTTETGESSKILATLS